MSATSYVPYISGRTSARFSGDTAADVLESILKNAWARDALNLSGAAGYHLHALSLGAATRSTEGRGLTRIAILKWSAAQTLPQEMAGEVNPVEERRIYLERGSDDNPGAEWQWALRDGKLVAVQS